MLRSLFAAASGAILVLVLTTPQIAVAEDGTGARSSPSVVAPEQSPPDPGPADPSNPANPGEEEPAEEVAPQAPKAPQAALAAEPEVSTSVVDLDECPAGEGRNTPMLYNGPDVWAPVDGGTSATPPKLGAWSNLPDMQYRGGYWDPMGREPLTFATGFARLICGAADNAEINISMYFVRALTIDPKAPETDANAIWDALEWVHANRNVKVRMILEGQNSCVVAADGQSCSSPGSGGTSSDHDDVRQKVAQRFESIGDVTYCINACFNTKRFGTYFYGIEHEKFVTISDTEWPNSQAGTGPDPGQHPVVISSSGNWARSQIRSYVQDAMYVYDDYKMFREFDQRWDAMESCANNKCAIAKNPGETYSALHVAHEGDRGIWASTMVRRPTDAGKGSEVIFSPQRSTDVNAYISQLDAVDCKVDSNVRVAMFNMTDGLAQQMANRLRTLASQGCDVEILLSLPGGGRGLSSSVINTLNAARIPYLCTARSMHTKLILIGPDFGAGSILEGTQNMSVSGQLYSDEHIISIKAQNVTKPGYRADLSVVYGQYLSMFTQLKGLKGDNGEKASKGLCG